MTLPPGTLANVGDIVKKPTSKTRWLVTQIAAPTADSSVILVLESMSKSDYRTARTTLGNALDYVISERAAE